MFHLHPVLQSFDLPHFEVLPRAPCILFWMTSAQDLQVWQGTRSNPCHTADYNPALGCHFHTLLQGIDPSRCQGNVTDVHVVASYGFTVVGEPQEELSPVHNFLLASMVIFHHIGRYPVRHVGHHRMQIATPPVLELPPLSSEGI